MLAVIDGLVPLRNDAERHLLLRPLVALGASQDLDFRGLAFLIQVKDSDLMSRLDLAEAQFKTAVVVLAERNATHLRMQERLAASGVRTGEINSEALSPIVGRDVVLQLKQMTDGLYESTERALAINRACVDAIQQFMLTASPGERVPRVIDEPRSK